MLDMPTPRGASGIALVRSATMRALGFVGTVRSQQLRHVHPTMELWRNMMHLADMERLRLSHGDHDKLVQSWEQCFLAMLEMYSPTTHPGTAARTARSQGRPSSEA